jgi:hypothetical protein
MPNTNIHHLNRNPLEQKLKLRLDEVEDVISWVFGPDTVPAYDRHVKVAETETPRVQAVADARADC